jgi:hypothetical protein
MTFSINRVDGPLPVNPVPEPTRKNTRGAEKADFASDLSSASAASSSPPPEVSAEVQEAAAAAANLLAEGRELRFDHDEDGRLRVQLQDTQGNALRSVPTAEIFDFAEGKVTD